jgi:hypothetical protein
MDTICLNDIKEIIRNGGGVHVSIFMPTHSRGGMDQQDPIRLRNLLRVAERQLEDSGLRSTEARALIKPAETLLTDNLFWRQQSDGLALFIEPDMYFYYHVPIVLREEDGVGKRFHIKSLIPLLSDCGWFYVLGISQNEIRLLQCTASGSVRLNLADIPRSKEEALRYETPDNRMQHHVQAPSGGSNLGGATAIQSGEGSRPNYNKRNVMQYLSQVSNGIQNILKEEQAPLVLVAVDYIHSMYRDVNLYHNLLPEGVMGNPDGVGDNTIREQAWTIVRPYFSKIQKDAAADFDNLAGTGLTTTGLTDVIPAAYHGRVRFLFIAEGVQQWGRFQPDTNTVTIHPEMQNGDEDLIDLAAFETLNHAGLIYTMNPVEVPGGPPASAILRF